LLGGAEAVHWFFEARAPGRTTLQLESRRPWDLDGPAAATLDLAVVVHAGNGHVSSVDGGREPGHGG
jgi:hypothetical protein